MYSEVPRTSLIGEISDCITFTANGDEDDLRGRLNAPANELSQDLYVSDVLPTTRVMIKDENVCLHCGLCAERCPTAAWDMQKYLYSVTKAGNFKHNGAI